MRAARFIRSQLSDGGVSREVDVLKTLTVVRLQMTKDSRTLSLEMDADSQGGTPRDTSPDMQPIRPAYDEATHPSER